MNILNLYKEEWYSRRNSKFDDYPRNKIVRKLFPPVNSKSVLDLGCGNGIVSEYLMKSGYEVSAIDIAPEAIKQVKQRGISKATVGNVEEKLPFKPSSFDAAFWGDNIEHVIFPAGVLAEINRVLKSGGKLVISTPNMGFILYRWNFLKYGQLPGTEGFFSEPWEWKHIRFFNEESLRKLLKIKGFRVTRVFGITSSALYNFLSRIYPSLFSPILVVEAFKK